MKEFLCPSDRAFTLLTASMPTRCCSTVSRGRWRQSRILRRGRYSPRAIRHSSTCDAPGHVDPRIHAVFVHPGNKSYTQNRMIDKDATFSWQFMFDEIGHPIQCNVRKTRFILGIAAADIGVIAGKPDLLERLRLARYPGDTVPVPPHGTRTKSFLYSSIAIACRANRTVLGKCTSYGSGQRRIHSSTARRCAQPSAATVSQTPIKYGTAPRSGPVMHL